MEKARTKRSWKNVKLTGKFRFRFLGLWTIVCFFLIALVDLAVFLLYRQTWQNYEPQGADPAAELAFRNAGMFATVGLVTVIFALAVLILVVFTAHRIGGPYIALKRTLTLVRDGDLSARLKFREYDKLADVENVFNAMMDALQQQAEGRPSRPAEPLLKAVGE